MKKIIILSILLILSLFLLSMQENFPDFKSFIFNGEEFLCFNKANDLKNIKDNGMIFALPENKENIQYRSCYIRNGKVKYDVNHFLSYSETIFNNNECYAEFSEDKDNSSISLNLFSKKSLNLLYHTVNIYNENKKLVFIQLIEYDYINGKVYYYEVDKNNNNEDKEINNLPENHPSGLNNSLFYFDIYYVTKFAFIKNLDDYLNNKKNILVRVRYLKDFYKIKLVKKEQKEGRLNGNIIKYNYYLFNLDLPIYQSIFVNNKNYYFELYISNDNERTLLKYNAVYQIENEILQDFSELIGFNVTH